MMMPKQNKYYIDASMYSDADSVASRVQAAFPKIRFGVGPASLNTNFEGDEAPIVAYISNRAPLKSGGAQIGAKSEETKRFVPVPSPSGRENSAPPEEIQYKDGDAVFVLSLGIEGKIKNVLPQGIVIVELADGITETMLAKNLEPAPKAAASRPNDAPPVVPPKASAAPPASANAQSDGPSQAPPASGGES
jgi:hypothetical protein